MTGPNKTAQAGHGRLDVGGQLMQQESGQLFFSISEVAALLGLNERTIRRWLCAKKLSGHRLGRQWRISRSDLDVFLAKHRHQACRSALQAVSRA